MIIEIHTNLTGTIETNQKDELVFDTDFLTPDLRYAISKHYRKGKAYAGIEDIHRLLTALYYVLGIDENKVTIVRNGIPKDGIFIDVTLDE